MVDIKIKRVSMPERNTLFMTHFLASHFKHEMRWSFVSEHGRIDHAEVFDSAGFLPLFVKLAAKKHSFLFESEMKLRLIPNPRALMGYEVKVENSNYCDSLVAMSLTEAVERVFGTKPDRVIDVDAINNFLRELPEKRNNEALECASNML